MSTAPDSVAAGHRPNSTETIESPLNYVLKHPGVFFARTIKSFRANQGLLLAGAIAYYALLSIIPLLGLIVIALSHLIDQAVLLSTLGHYLEWIVPGQSKAVVSELASLVEHRDVIGWVLLMMMLFFSSLAFVLLEKALSVIFLHRFTVRHRRFIVSAVLPYCYILLLGVGFLVITLVSGALQALGTERVDLFGHDWSLGGLSGVLLYLLGLAGEIFVLTSIYLVMPVGWLSVRHALIGAVTAALLWELTRHFLVWYFATVSQVAVVYGSLATWIVVLLSLEIGATALLVGAQVIAEYERLGRPDAPAPPKSIRTG
jgi:membrane protein